MTTMHIRGGISVPKDGGIFNHCHLTAAYIVIQVCMYKAAVTICICHVCQVYAQAARLILQARAHNSQPVIGKGGLRAAAAAAAAARRAAPPRGPGSRRTSCVSVWAWRPWAQASAEERAEETQSVDVPVKAGQCTSEGRHTLASREAVCHGGPTYLRESVLQARAGQ